jgi:uncharacterized protein YneR
MAILRVTDEAVACLKEEWAFGDGEIVRIYARYAGGDEPYALGIWKESQVPDGNGNLMQTNAGGITFFIEEKDQWFLQGQDLTIDAEHDNIRFIVGT